MVISPRISKHVEHKKREIRLHYFNKLQIEFTYVLGNTRFTKSLDQGELWKYDKHPA